ncbi:metalloendoproteinase 5-MMP-like [Aristolochia californica]|uniref:metalloendoproteinase 5-MMP-like n=1 Tax=Aristolochia californica TaxID=171875 RepID=UPI0035E273C0
MGFLHKAFLLLFILSLATLPCFVFCRKSHGRRRLFQNLQPLEGSRLGETVTGLHKLKHYLARFGYLANAHIATGPGEDDHFDDHLESALKLYQTTFSLNVSGVVDAATLDLMMEPRCGVPDFFNGSVPGIGPRWAILPGRPKWPADKQSHLKWGWLQPNFPFYFAEPSVIFAIQKWAYVTGFFFIEVPFEQHKGADIKVGFFKGAHGDYESFDGPEGILAHAMFPTSAFVHFDIEENWSVYKSDDSVDFISIALHELGHALGLAHSKVKEAVMYPKFGYGEQKRELTQDDIDGIKNLYP